MFHHIGRLERDSRGRLQYIGEEVIEIKRVNVDTLNIFFVEGLLMDIGYTGFKECYWLEPKMELDGGLRLLQRDMNVVKMCEVAIKNGNKVHLDFEHPVANNPKVVDVPETLECSYPPHNPPITPHHITHHHIQPQKCHTSKVLEVE